MVGKNFWNMFLENVFEVLISGGIFSCYKTKALRIFAKNPECKTERIYLRMFIHPRHHAWTCLARINSRGKRV